MRVFLIDCCGGDCKFDIFLLTAIISIYFFLLLKICENAVMGLYIYKFDVFSHSQVEVYPNMMTFVNEKCGL